MREWERILLAAAPILVLATLSILSIWRCYYLKQHSHRARTESSQDGIAKSHQVEELNTNKRRSSKHYNIFTRGASTKPLFNWVDHPSLITDAVEKGWCGFGFASYVSSSRSTLLCLCRGGDKDSDSDIDIRWEVCQGSADFMQKIRLNPGLRKQLHKSGKFSAVSVIRTALPLPGPPLGNSAFPQEAYFEITILDFQGGRNDQEIVDPAKVIKEGEKTKLIHGGGNIEELKLGGKDDGIGVDDDDDDDDDVWLSLGLSTGGGSLPLRLPGSYPASVGFNSNGSIFLDGIQRVLQSEKKEWLRTNKVIGCGYDPRQKKVLFTVDSELVHVIHCKSEEFGTPLYPTIAANNDIEVLVNFGQSAFSYAPANLQRTPNPCFIGPLVKSPTLGYEDSKELFSMGRIDSQWLSTNSTRGTTYHSSNINGANYPVVDFDEESDADLFEIVLDRSGRSPMVPL